MQIKEEDLKKIIGKNIQEYRKVFNMSQLDLAEKLNYSDKAISKWERGESLPDILVLKNIADIFEITVNDLLGYQSEKTKKTSHFKKLMQNKILLLLLSIGVVWLISTITFLFFEMFKILDKYNYLAFIYAIPASFILCVIFFAIWKNHIMLTISESLLIWSLALSICLSIPKNNIWLLLFICIPSQILILLWSWFTYFRKRRKSKSTLTVKTQ